MEEFSEPIALVQHFLYMWYYGRDYFLPDQRSETAHNRSYVRLLMMRSWRKRSRSIVSFIWEKLHQYSIRSKSGSTCSWSRNVPQ